MRHLYPKWLTILKETVPVNVATTVGGWGFTIIPRSSVGAKMVRPGGSGLPKDVVVKERLHDPPRLPRSLPTSWGGVMFWFWVGLFWMLVATFTLGWLFGRTYQPGKDA